MEIFGKDIAVTNAFQFRKQQEQLILKSKRFDSSLGHLMQMESGKCNKDVHLRGLLDTIFLP